MAQVHMLSAASTQPSAGEPDDLRQLVRSAALDRRGAHRVTDSPAEADLILFVETGTNAGRYFEEVRRHEIYTSWRDKCYLFCSTDRVLPLLPGVFASIEKSWYMPAWTRSGHYLGVEETEELAADPRRRPSRLFSFVGSAGAHPVRKRLLSLHHPDGQIEDTGGRRGDLTPHEYRRRYADSLHDSAFILCPRGRGTSSFRLFEAMMLGRPPVIISDQWVPPAGPDWETFSMRVPESAVRTIPGLCQSRAADAEAMGAAAREAWLSWFSPQVSFDRIVTSCADLDRFASGRQGLSRAAPKLQYLRPYHAARWARSRARPLQPRRATHPT